jgi:hypothetical protein
MAIIAFIPLISPLREVYLSASPASLADIPFFVTPAQPEIVASLREDVASPALACLIPQ